MTLEKVQALQSRFESRVGDADSLQISEDSRAVSDYIAGHVANKAKKISDSYCHELMIN